MRPAAAGHKGKIVMDRRRFLIYHWATNRPGEQDHAPPLALPWPNGRSGMRLTGIRRWLGVPFASTRSRRPNGRAQPRLEWLEDRTTPTILFTPQFGAESATDHGGYKL